MISIMFTVIETHLRDIRSRVVTLAAGQYLFHAGDPVRDLFVTRRGGVHLVRHQPDGSVLVLQRGGPGSIVAEASVYSDSYHCDGVAWNQRDAARAGDTQVVAFARTEIVRHLRENADFADAWARHLAHELQRVRMLAEILSIRTVAKRLDAWMAWRNGECPRRGDWHAVANEIGVSPEALYRELARRRHA